MEGWRVKKRKVGEEERNQKHVSILIHVCSLCLHMIYNMSSSLSFIAIYYCNHMIKYFELIISEVCSLFYLHIGFSDHCW